MFGELSQQTIELMKQIDLRKTTISQTSPNNAFNAFDLRGPALQLYPVLTPLRNKLARVLSDRGDTATRWKAVTGVNTTNLDIGVAGGKRSAEVQITEQDFLAAYAGIGLEGSIDWEAVWSGGMEFDNKATLSTSLLRSVMIGEESIILNGNASVAFGTCPTPVATLLTAQGALTAQATQVWCVALTARGFLNATVAGGVPGSVVRTNIDGTSLTYGGGSSQVSAGSNAVTTTGSNLGVSATVASVPGAVAYAWYIGNAAGTASLHSVTTVNAQTFLANPAGTQKANDAAVSSDHSTNNTIFDGFASQAAKSGSGAYIKSLDGAVLTSDGANGVVQIDAALQSFWDNKRLSPTDIWVNSQEAQNINKKVVNNGGVPLFRFVQQIGDGNPAPAIMGGTSTAKYWNKYTQQYLNLNIHPNQVASTILFTTDEIPYPLSGVDKVNYIQCRRDYYQIEWPIVSRQYVYGVYADEVLVCRAPFACGLIQNVLNG